MKKINCFCIIFVFLLIAGCSKSTATQSTSASSSTTSSGVSGPTYELTFANSTAETHPMNLACLDLIKLIEERSGGRFHFTNYPNSTLGEDVDMFEMIQNGSLDFALNSGSVGNTSKMFPALQLPFMYSDWDHYLEVIQSDVTKELLNNFDIDPVKVLAVYDAGYRHLVLTGKPIENMNDFRGQKLRVAENPLHIAIFQALGSSPTPLTYGEIYSALQNKLIDSLEMDLSAILLNRYYEVAKTVELTGHFTWPGICSVNRKLWDSFSPEDQDMIQQAAWDVMAMNVATIQKREAEIRDQLTKDGVNFVVPNQELTMAMQEATKSVVDTYSQTNQYTKKFVEYAFSTQKK
jgi:tripartite ATP-independent transporter DctP family solute receptor